MRSRRTRDYKAEYARRVAGVPRGQRRVARGHKPPAYLPPTMTEYQVRAHQTRVKYGTTPTVLTRLRREAANHIIAELMRVGTRKPINTATVAGNMRKLNAYALRNIIAVEGEDMLVMASKVPAEALASPLFGERDLMEADLEDEELEFNPFWYH